MNNKYNFPLMENKIMEFWEDNKVLDKYLKKNKNSTKTFSYLDGPITANNPMGIHHVEARTVKDTWRRYKNMNGYKQRFQNGFDCQGLWVEVEEERELGFNSKKDIEKFGVSNFVESCKSRVRKYSQMQIEQSKRIGMFMDWKNSYYTYSDKNNEYIWQFLKICQKKKLLYKNNSVTTWCPRCETGLSLHEKMDGYKDIECNSLYVKFKVKNTNNEYFLAWTTTSWTLCANMLLAVNPKIKYVKAIYNNEFLYLSEESARRLKFKNYENVNVNDLIGMDYEPLYDFPEFKEVEHVVVSWKEVESDEGSGVVHIAPGCGEEDYYLYKRLYGFNTKIISPIDTTGYYFKEFGDLSGKYAHDVDQDVINYLHNNNRLFRVEKITHSYPHCWRCKTKCLFRLEDSWYIKMDTLRPKLIKMCKSVKWSPSFAMKRCLNWLKNMEDWMISRKRYYGLALPFYECSKCGRLTVIGNKSELKDLSAEKDKADKLPSLHRPYIDEVQIKCPKCGNLVNRIKDVGDVWLDAGVVPFSTQKYLEDKKFWKEWYPADLVSEMIEQVRLWYYSCFVYAVVFGCRTPFKYVLNNIEVRDKNNVRLSKSKYNSPPPEDVGERHGLDIVRWLYLSQSVSAAYMKYSDELLNDISHRFYLVLWNCYQYYLTYSKLKSFDVWENTFNNSSNILDNWVLSEYNSLVKDVTYYMDKYDSVIVCKKIEKFVNDLSTWYIRRSRNRFVSGDIDALNTLHYLLLSISKLLAPFIPFVTEEMYQNLKSIQDPVSVHLCEYPKYERNLSRSKLSKDMIIVRKICALVNSIRAEKKIKIRQPLELLMVKGVTLNKKFKEIILEEINVRKLLYVDKYVKKKGLVSKRMSEFTVILDTNISKSLQEDGFVRECIRKVQQKRKLRGYMLTQKVKLVLILKDKNLHKILLNNKSKFEKLTNTNLVEVTEKQKDTNKSYLYVKID